MMNKLNFNKPIYVVGDIHGYFQSLVAQIKRYDLNDCVIVVAGDCGVGFSSAKGLMYSLYDLNNICEKRNIDIVFVRGNHDDPDYFNSEEPFHYGKIQCVPDYTVINDETLCIGGATSIDRIYRQNDYEKRRRDYLRYHDETKIDQEVFKSYWENEHPYFSQDFFKGAREQGLEIKHVITHTCPSSCVPQTKDGISHWLNYDKDLSKDLDIERSIMDKILEALKEYPLQSWTYGHYHFHYDEYIHTDDFPNGIKFTLLSAVIMAGGYPDMVEIK